MAAGPPGAILLTAALFAAMHVANYGVAAIPLDLGVGIGLGLLRELTGRVGGCVAAHVIADLGSWWIA
jgi:membrane protease YdiL (CAAX protease family)